MPVGEVANIGRFRNTYTRIRKYNLGKEKYFAKNFEEVCSTTLKPSTGTFRPQTLLGIASSDRANPGRDLHVLTVSPTPH